MKVSGIVFFVFTLGSSAVLAVECSVYDRDLALDPETADAQLQLARGPAARVTMNNRVTNLNVGVPSNRLVPFAAETMMGRERTRLDVSRFAAVLDQQLDGAVSGYAAQLRKNGAIIHSSSKGWARRYREDGKPNVEWSADTRMHVASISKLLTAMAFTRLLKDNRIGVDDAIIDYLPAHWKKGKNIERITFAHLLTHTSGFDTRTSYSDYGFMKAHVARGVFYPKRRDPRDDPNDQDKTETGIGVEAYQNMNFGLMRILLPIINKSIDKNAAIPDSQWDEETVKHYESYMRRVVFEPAGVTGARLARTTDTALAYDFPNTMDGDDTGKLTCLAGGAGWYMTLNEVMNILGVFRRSGLILEPGAARDMLDAKFGIDWKIQIRGRDYAYTKSGEWYDYNLTANDDLRLQMEQAAVLFLPEDMELVVFANSRVAQPGKYLVDLVLGIYKAHVETTNR